ncbi:MAG: aminotransferase class I/II-fold pyridoxal phosphate-dependent enzyme [Dorea sp.]|nr:aminotransferase class I/II-fold pyridoxal phosphate-dependent enzyme [Dorea sp.]
MIPLAVPNLEGQEREYLNRCIDTTFISSVGEYVNKLEELTAQKTDAKYGVATSAGTTGLHASLVGCGVEEGEIVIIPTFTFIATANAVAHCKAIPWLIDIDSSNWCMSAQNLEEELSRKVKMIDGKVIHKESGRRVAAIMPVYTLGEIPDMEKIGEIARKYNLPLVADAAAAVGAEYKGLKIGKLADLTVLSFNGNKTVTAGGGGMVLGNKEELMKNIKHITTTARVTSEYDHDMVGYNYRMTNVQAAIGCAQMERMEKLVDRKRKIRSYYNKEFRKIEGISLFPENSNVRSACWFSGLVLDKGGIEIVREICASLRVKGIESRSFWKPVHLQKPYMNSIKADSLERAEHLWDKIITLPCSTNISNSELEQVVNAVKEVIN